MKRSGAREALSAWGCASVALLAFGACSASKTAAPARPSLLEPANAPGAGTSARSEWRYHPRRPAGLERGYPLPEGQRLLVGAAGERWLVAARHASAASMLAPEALVGVLPRDGGFAFIGRSGAAYSARSALGPFVSSNAPLVDMAKVDANEHHVLGVSRGGELWLSEDAGAGWRRVGPPSARFADAVLSGARGLALELPERLWVSDDEGRSWRALGEPAFGARALARDGDGGAVALSALGARALTQPSGLTPLGRVFVPAELTLDALPALGPSARALAQGRAVDRGGRYFELVLGVKAEVISGPSFGELERRQAPEFAACSDAGVGGFERWVYVACTRERNGSSRQLELYRSDDGGASFEREPYVARGDPELLRLAVGQDGALLVTGVCAPGESVAGCRPRGIARRVGAVGDAGAAVALVAVAAPALEEHARALAFSSDGRKAYALGPRTKSDALFAFVSDDLERGFNPRPLGTLEQEARNGSDVLELSASAEGQLSLVLRDGSGAERLVVLDAEARTLSVNAAPADAAAIGAHGDRALAVSPDEVWESLNGGAEWQSVGRLPRSVCAASAGRCAVRVHCDAEGCTIGDSLSRRGWRGRTEPVPLPPAPPARPRAAGRALGLGYGCELSSSEWAELRGVDRLPDAAQAALGRAAWFALASDDATASAGLFLADGSSAPDDRVAGVRYSELLGGVSHAGDFAYYATLQVEGGAALRFRVPEGAGSTASIAQVEVAWENLFEGQHRRAIILDAGAPLPGDIAKGDGIARRAQPDLVSIASGGIFVRMHRQPQQNQPTYYLDGARVERVPALPWSFTPVKDVSFEMARLGSESIQIGFVDRGATVVRARRSHDAWQFDARSIGYATPDDFSIEQHRDIAYAGGQTAVLLTLRRADGSTESQLFPLRADGPVLGEPLAAPTQRDLPDAPAACTPRQRAETSRVVAPWYPGRRRPLVVHDAVEPLRVFLTDEAVLYGSPQSPCLAAFDTDLVRVTTGGGGVRERALVFPDEPSWLFRLSPDSARREPRVEYRSMTCRPDPSLELPPEVYEMPGTERVE